MAGLAKDEIDRLLLVGVDRTSLPTALAEKLFDHELELPRLLNELAALQAQDSMVVATSQRLEFLVARGQDSGLIEPLIKLLAGEAGATAAEIAAGSYCHEGEAAVAHVFALTAALESPVPGERQTQEQIEACWEQASRAGMSGPVLETLLRAAYDAAERIRQETLLAEQPASMAAAALRMAERLHGDLARCRVLMIGLGEMGELLAGELQRAGVSDLVLIHRSSARAEISARRRHCHFRAWEELPAALEQADILLSDQGSGRWTVTRDQIAQALRARRRRPMFVIDLAVPRDIEDSVNDLPDAFVYNLDDLETLALEGHADGDASAQQAEAILAEETARFLQDPGAPMDDAVMAALEAHFEAARSAALAESDDDAAAATRLLIKRLLRGPAAALRDSAAEGPDSAVRLAQMLRRLFSLGPDEDDDRKR